MAKRMIAKRIVFYVRPYGAKFRGITRQCWDVAVGRARTVPSVTVFVTPNKADAVRFAKELARALWRDLKHPTQVRVMNRNGRWAQRDEATYGRDPRRSKG